MDRISALASMVPDNSKIVDVGCDHGYLGITLISQNRGISVISSDISNNALESARKNVFNTFNQDIIQLRVGNGLEVVEVGEVDTVVIAGMGAHLQMEILISGKSKLESVNTIILSPNDGAFYIRNNLNLIGYYIDDEKLVFENGKFYPLIKLKKGFKDYSYDELLMGPVLLNNRDEVFYNYYTEILNKKKMILKELPSKYQDKIDLTSRDISILNKYLQKK